MNIIKYSIATIMMTFSVFTMAEVAVIVNAANANTVDASNISRIFLGKAKAFANGEVIEVINLKAGTPSRDAFESAALNKSASQIKAYWSKRVFSGKGKPPKELASDAEVLAYIAANKSAIGYIDASLVDASVKVVAKY